MKIDMGATYLIDTSLFGGPWVVLNKKIRYNGYLTECKRCVIVVDKSNWAISHYMLNKSRESLLGMYYAAQSCEQTMVTMQKVHIVTYISYYYSFFYDANLLS